MSAVPGYPSLRWTGGAAQPAEQHVSPVLLGKLQQAATRLGVVIDIFSGSGGPEVRHAGFAGDPHARGIAVDASVRGTPIGSYPGAVAVLHSLGLRSGATDFTYQGRPDAPHVDLLAGGAQPVSSSSSTSSVSSQDGFFTLVLHDLGIEATPGNLVFFKGWAMVEGTAAKNNPLATTLRVPGSVPLQGNSAGVQQYATPEQGAAATAATIRGGYPNIVAALKTHSPLVTGITPGIVADFGKWSGGNGADYARKVFLAAQGNPSGKSAADIGSFDLGDAGNVAGGVVGDVLAVPRFLAKITDPHNILRGLQIVAGAVLVLAGLLLLARQVGLAPDAPGPVGKLASAAPAPAVE